MVVASFRFCPCIGTMNHLRVAAFGVRQSDGTLDFSSPLRGLRGLCVRLFPDGSWKAKRPAEPPRSRRDKELTA
jgi:hypothetical protein